MKLRIIAGHLKRRNIEIPDAAVQFRPTKDTVRGAVADYLMKKIEDSTVADICAGSGAFGFEMLSRGAQCVHFVEKNRVYCERIGYYTRVFNMEDQCRIFRKDVRHYLKSCTKRYDIVYYDPPYNDAALAELVPNMLSIVAADGIFIFERRRKGAASQSVSEEFTLQVRTYGKTMIEIYTHTI